MKYPQGIPVLIVLIFVHLAGCSSQEDLDNRMALMAKSGDIAKVKELLAKGANIDSRDKEHNATALMWAAHEGHIELLNFLIANQAAIEAVKSNGQTPLWYAAQQGRLKAAEILLKNGANANVATQDGISALMIAQQNNHPDIVELLSKKGATK